MEWEPTPELRYANGRATFHPLTGDQGFVWTLQQKWRRMTRDHIDVNGTVLPLNGYDTEWRDVPYSTEIK